MTSKRPAPPNAQGLGQLPASWQGELPGASGGITWHLDLHADGRYQLRMTYERPDGPQSFDDIGRWARDHAARVVLHGGREAPVLLQPLEDGEALRKLDTTGQIIESTHNDRLKRLPAFTPIEPQLFLSGLFSYMADAPNITLCVNQQRMPVAMEKQFPLLQAAYRTSGVQPGQVALVSVEGVIAMRPSAEEGQPPRATLVVQRFVSISPQRRCPSPKASGPLRNTY
ncbi:MAG: copper resistance protein NlpE N-terminal domain-containing protein [Aquabacterium sp.]|jgi:copper homeostasis protein (lipoprotein)